MAPNDKIPWGDQLGGISPEVLSITPSHGLGEAMLIVAHIGESINEYRAICRWYWPEECPCCAGGRFRRHGSYSHGAGDEKLVQVFRFRCSTSGCGQVFTVLPDLFTPHESLPTAVEEEAVFEYAAKLGACSKVAEGHGVSTTTVRRWVQQAASEVAAWVGVPQPTDRSSPNRLHWVKAGIDNVCEYQITSNGNAIPARL